MQSVLAAPENIEYWTTSIQPLVRERFGAWAKTGEAVSLFRGISDLVMTVLFHLFLGDEFADRHAKELVPMVRAYEKAMQKPETKVLPRWMSRNGRLLDSVEEHFRALCDEEIARRLNNMDKYRGQKDYLQLLLNAVGGRFAEGIVVCFNLRSLSLSHPQFAERGAYESNNDIRLVSASCFEIASSFCPS
jgi:hypothetical protein